MRNAVYKYNMLNQVDVKDVKRGIRSMANNSRKAKTFHAALGLSLIVMQFIQDIHMFLLDGRLDKAQKEQATDSLMHMGAYLIVLSSALKVKLPVATKKVLHKGTKGALALSMLDVSAALLALQRDSMALSGEPSVVADAQHDLNTNMVNVLTQFIGLYYAATWAFAGKTPAELYDEHVKYLDSVTTGHAYVYELPNKKAVETAVKTTA